MKKNLIEYIDTLDTNKDFDIYEFIANVEGEFEGYVVDTWNWDDYDPSQAAESIVEWIADHTVDRTVEDIQSTTFWANEDNECYTVVIIKTK